MWPPVAKVLVGVDVFLDWDESDRDPNALGSRLTSVATKRMRLKMVTNRGVKVYPDGLSETFCTDHWRCRFVGDGLAPSHVVDLLSLLGKAGLDVIKTENLYTFDGQPGYSLGQGE